MPKAYQCAKATRQTPTTKYISFTNPLGAYNLKVYRNMISRESAAGLVYFLAGYFAYTNWLFPSLVTLAGATVLLKVKSLKMR